MVRAVVLAGLYAGLYAAFNYLSTVAFGLPAQTAIILSSPSRVFGIIVCSFVLGALLGLLACRLIRPLQAQVFTAAARYAG